MLYNRKCIFIYFVVVGFNGCINFLSYFNARENERIENKLFNIILNKYFFNVNKL